MGYKQLAIAAGAAALIALVTCPVAAQSGPEQQAAPPPGPDQSGPPPPGAPSQAPPAVVNTTVNLRQGPGTTYTVVGKIPAGSPVDVGNCNGQWCQVTWQGQNGFVIASSLGQEGGDGGPPPPGAVAGGPPGYPPPPGYGGPVYGAPPPYYGPYYYGYGPYYGRPYYYGYGYGWHRHW